MFIFGLFIFLSSFFLICICFSISYFLFLLCLFRGLKYFSQHRERRIKLIAEHLSHNDYDIVFLQEVWTESDYEFIRQESQSKYVFSHMFKNASLLGTSGLVIMAKWIPTMIHFYPFSINGSPFRINHGDWFSTKGVAYARIELSGFKVHLFCTHVSFIDFSLFFCEFHNFCF